MNWKIETGSNGTMAWLTLGSQMELSLLKRNSVRNDLYQYRLRWGTGHELAPMNCHWKENLTAKDWDEAKSKAIKRSKYIINSYIHELNWAMEVLNHEDCSVD